MKSEVGLKTLISSMNGLPSTNNWDIVTSYSEKQLNTFLKNQYNAGKLAKKVELSTTRVSPLLGTQFSIDYSIYFESPKLSFIEGRSGFARLEMPIGKQSQYTITPKGDEHPTRKKEIPADTYSLKAIVPLAAIHGSTGQISELGDVVTFSSGNPEASHVIIHFNNQKGTSFSIDPAPKLGDKDILEIYFLPVIKEYFQTHIHAIDYALAGVNNEIPAKGDTVFTPKSFVFAAMGSSGSSGPGVLSLYIQTEQSGNPPGNPVPSFQPGGTAISPVPEKYTASIILSNVLIKNSFLKPQIEASGFSVNFVDTTKEAIKASLTKNTSVIVGESNGEIIDSSYYYDGLNLSMESNPVTLEINNSQITSKWSGMAKSSWGNRTFIETKSGGQNGTVNLSISMTKGPIVITVDNDGITIPDFTFKRSDFNVTPKAESCDFLQTAQGCVEIIPPFYTTDLNLQIPSIKLKLHGFNYFRETNLLAPGKELIDISSDAGLATPYDFLIVGHVNTKSDEKLVRDNSN